MNSRSEMRRLAVQNPDALVEEIERLRAENEGLKEPAAFGWQCYQDRCENAYIEASVVKGIEADNARLREALTDLVEQFEPQTRPDHEILQRARAALAGARDDANECERGVNLPDRKNETRETKQQTAARGLP